MSLIHVAIFTRAPVAGVAKTRLIPLLGAEGAAHAQQAMTWHMLEMATALPGACPCALMVAASGACTSANSMLTTNRALMNPIPTLAVALKWVSSMTSIDSTPGPHLPT